MKIWFALEAIWAEALIAFTKQNPTRNYWLTITSFQTNQQPKHGLTYWERKTKTILQTHLERVDLTCNCMYISAEKQNKSRNMQQGEGFFCQHSAWN